MGFILLVISHYIKKYILIDISHNCNFLALFQHNAYKFVDILKIYSHLCFFLCVLQEDLQDKWNWIRSIHECWPEGAVCVSCSILVSTLYMCAIWTSAAVSLVSTGIYLTCNSCILLRFTLTFNILGSVRFIIFLKEMNTFILQGDIKFT